MYIALSFLLGLIFFISAVGFGIFALKFYKLRDVVYISIKDMGELIALLALYDKVENPEQRLARMLKMSEEEVKRELEKGRIMNLVGQLASQVLENLKKSVPDIIEPIEEEMKK
jgi:hypothetical protein